VKRFLDPGLQAKIHILSSAFLPKIAPYIHEEAIPAYLGGQLRDANGDPQCAGLVGPGGVIPMGYLVRVANDGRGMGEEVLVAHGKYSDLTLRVPPGATVQWRWAMQDRDVSFSVTAASVSPSEPKQALSAYPAYPADDRDKVAADDVLDCTGLSKSTFGVHRLRTGYDTKTHLKAHGGKPLQAVTTGDVKADKFPKGAAAAVACVAAEKLDKHFGSWTNTSATEEAFVRLRWDNGYAWVHAKHLVRRVDVLLPAEKTAALAATGVAFEDVEEDPLEALAGQRREAWEKFGL
jgi:hypothetical protein